MPALAPYQSQARYGTAPVILLTGKEVSPNDVISSSTLGSGLALRVKKT